MGKKIIYFVKQAFASFKMNRVMSVASVAVVFLCLMMVASFAILSGLANVVLGGQEKRIEIDVFLKENAPLEQVKALENKIGSWPEITEIHYVSKKEALNKLKKWLKDSPEILEAISGNPLPASYQVKFQSPRQVKDVVKRIKKQPDYKAVVDEIKYPRSFIDQFIAVVQIIRWVLVSFGVALGFIALTLIVSTIRLTIFARRKEVAIMRLVGASNWFIRWPFILEGVLQGLLGALMVIAILYFAKVAFFKVMVSNLFGFFRVGFDYSVLSNQLWWLFVILLLGGIFIGAAGSVIALRRFLKV